MRILVIAERGEKTLLPSNILKCYVVFKKNVSFLKLNRCVNLLFILTNDLVIREISGFADEKCMSKKKGIHLRRHHLFH